MITQHLAHERWNFNKHIVVVVAERFCVWEMPEALTEAHLSDSIRMSRMFRKRRKLCSSGSGAYERGVRFLTHYCSIESGRRAGPVGNYTQECSSMLCRFASPGRYEIDIVSVHRRSKALSKCCRKKLCLFWSRVGEIIHCRNMYSLDHWVM